MDKIKKYLLSVVFYSSLIIVLSLAFLVGSNGLDSPLSFMFQNVDQSKISTKQQNRINVADKANQNKETKDYNETIKKYFNSSGTVKNLTSNDLKTMIANNSSFLLYVRTKNDSNYYEKVKQVSEEQNVKIFTINGKNIENIAFQNQSSIATTQENVTFIHSGVPKTSIVLSILSDKNVSQSYEKWLLNTKSQFNK